METNEAGLALIKYWERNPRTGTFYDRAYQDEEGVWTIGWGTIRWDMKTPVKKGDTITAAEADRQLRIEVRRTDDAIDQCVKATLTSNQHSALAVWAYNVGNGWINGADGHQVATLIQRLNKGDYACVPAQLQRFTHGAVSGAHYDGLLNRRNQEIKLWLTADAEPHVDPVLVPEPEAAEMPPPQAVAPFKGSGVQAVKESWTIRGALIAATATVADKATSAYDWLFSVAKEAGPEVLALKTSIGPFDALLVAVKASMPSIMLVLTLAGIGIVISRRINAAKEGKIG